MRVYISQVDYIKYHLFDVFVPAYFQTAIPEHMKDPTPKPLGRVNPFRMTDINRMSNVPLYQPFDPHQIQSARYSIEIMLEMHAKKVEFELGIESDIVLILDALDKYLLTLTEDIRGGHEYAIAYARLVVSFREEVYKLYYRYMKLNPGVMDNLYPKQDKTKTLNHLLMAVGGEDLNTLDPLRARMKPPIDIDSLLPKNNQPLTIENLEGSLGIPKSGAFVDDGKDFKIDEFLQGFK